VVVVVVVVVVGRVVVVVVGTVVVVVGRVVVVVVVVGRVVVVVVVVGRVVVVVGTVVVVVGRVVVVVVGTVVVVVGRVVVVVTAVVVVTGVDPPHAVPLTLKLVGAVFAELNEPMKPADVEAPVARLPFHASLVTVTAAPDWANLPPQPCVTVCPLGKVKVNVHEDQASPVLVTLRSPWKPPGHWPTVE
jgi:hypothetical protein